jgi:hypothetical protein
MKALEFEVERDTIYNLSEGGKQYDGLRIRYRPQGVRRWTKFLVTLFEGEEVPDEHLPAFGLQAARAHYRRHAGAIAREEAGR